ncbi:hypothetical protein BDV12DRAFT_180130 [Aspergillus spectabilis]
MSKIALGACGGSSQLQPRASSRWTSSEPVRSSHTAHPLRHRHRTLNRQNTSNTPSSCIETSHIHPQTHSLFFRLPGELRNIIYYGFLPCKAPIHIRATRTRIYSWECRRARSARTADFIYEYCCQEPDAVNNKVGERTRQRSRVLGFLTSCKRIYVEATPLLYYLNTFQIHQPYTARALPQSAPTPSVLHPVSAPKHHAFLQVLH